MHYVKVYVLEHCFNVVFIKKWRSFNFYLSKLKNGEVRPDKMKEDEVNTMINSFLSIFCYYK
jgi:hypothetical protein